MITHTLWISAHHCISLMKPAVQTKICKKNGSDISSAFELVYIWSVSLAFNSEFVQSFDLNLTQTTLSHRQGAIKKMPKSIVQSHFDCTAYKTYMFIVLSLPLFTLCILYCGTQGRYVPTFIILFIFFFIRTHKRSEECY